MILSSPCKKIIFRHILYKPKKRRHQIFVFLDMLDPCNVLPDVVLLRIFSFLSINEMHKVRMVRSRPKSNFKNSDLSWLNGLEDKSFLHIWNPRKIWTFYTGYVFGSDLSRHRNLSRILRAPAGGRLKKTCVLAR